MFFIQHDRFYQELATCNWYTLPENEQKALILVLNAARNPKNLKIADMFPLNAGTYLTVDFDFFLISISHDCLY